LPIKIVGWALILCHDALARLLAADVANVPCDKVARRQGGKVASSLRAETTQCMWDRVAYLLCRQFSVCSRTKWVCASVKISLLMANRTTG